MQHKEKRVSDKIEKTDAEWREDLTKPFPTGGGLIPMSIGISKKDPWGTEYGYCVWDHGPAHNGAGS